FRGPDVEIKAILGKRFLAEIVIYVAVAQGLHAFGREAIGVIDALPRGARLRRLPAEVAERGLGEGDAEIGVHAGIEHLAGDEAGGRLDGIAGNRRGDDLRRDGWYGEQGRGGDGQGRRQRSDGHGDSPPNVRNGTYITLSSIGQE